ncbi:MAG: tripartite tricarboxylate transporter substrate binding protein [Pseudomonadota bacterium]
MLHMTVMRCLACAFALCAAASAPAFAQNYPNKPVRLLVPFAPGGGTDTLARMISQRLSDALGQPVVVDNRPAVDGIIATELAADSPPDGYTLLIVSSSHAINPALGRKLPYNTLKDFAPITQTANQQLLLVVHPSVQASSVKELIALVKAKPGAMNYGSSSNAVALPMELFKTMTGTDIQHVPYKGSGPMLTDLLGGQIQMAIAGAVSSIPQVKAGKLRALAIGDSKRSAFLPDLPTIAEAGVPGYQASIWSGMFLPAKASRALVDRLNREVVKIVQAPDFKERLLGMGSDAVGSTPEAWGKFIETEIAKWAKIAKAAGMKAG